MGTVHLINAEGTRQASWTLGTLSQAFRKHYEEKSLGADAEQSMDRGRLPGTILNPKPKP